MEHLSYAGLKALLSPPVDSLLRPWHSPADLIDELAQIIAAGGGKWGTDDPPTLEEPELAAVLRAIEKALSGAVHAYYRTKPPPDDARHFFANWLRAEAWRASLDPTTPLLAPHFHKQDRVAALVLPRGDDETTASADIRLLSARKLVAHIDGGGRMQIRQALEAAGTDVFVDAATVRKLLPELETKDDGIWGCCTFSSVVALSYACKPRRIPPAAALRGRV